MIKVVSLLLSLAISCIAFARDLRPAQWFEEVPATDASTQHSFVISTVPGVRYTVESSSDLVTWTTQSQIYGLGQDHVTAMYQSTPPPPPLPGAPSATPYVLSRMVSLKMQPATDGGTVVSWASLDDGTGRLVKITGEMIPEWEFVPMFCERYGFFSFNIWHPAVEIEPPLVNSLLGTNDTAMLASLEANLADMNQKVAASIARSRLVPSAAAPDPDAQKFWRVLCDWSLDTDADGAPDWFEFHLAATQLAAVPPIGSGLRADPFDPDTDRDGHLDGSQLGEASPLFPNTGNPRYALFPINHVEGDYVTFPGAKQISNKGTVLFENGTWNGGKWTPLQVSSPGVYPYGLAINDNDVILGEGGPFDVQVNSNTVHTEGVCYWVSPDAAPQLLSCGNGTDRLIARASYAFAYAGLSPGPVLSDDGYCTMGTAVWQPYGGSGYFRGDSSSVWKLPLNGQPATQVPGDGGQFYNLSADIRWGNSYVEGYGGIHAPNLLPALTYSPLNLAVIGNKILAMPGNPTQIFEDGGWKVCSEYRNAIDLSSDGVGIARNFDGLIAPCYIYGKIASISRTAPDVPTDWNDPAVEFLDTTPGGWILAKGKQTIEITPGLPLFNYAVMLPIRVSGFYSKESPLNEVTTKYCGVDDFSIGSGYPGEAVQDRIWIMAPLGGPAKTVTINSPIEASHPLVLSADGIDFGNLNGIGVIYGTGGTLSIHATTTAVTGSEVTANLKLTAGNPTDPTAEDSTTALSKPIGLKVMKQRTLHVTVYQVVKITPGKPNNPPDYVPVKADLEAYLNDIYKPQLNLAVEVKIEPTPLVVDWDLGVHDRSLDDHGTLVPNTQFKSHSAEQNIVAAARDLLGPHDENISIFILGGELPIGNGAWGSTNTHERTCWVMGDDPNKDGYRNETGDPLPTGMHDFARFEPYDSKLQYRTIAHEIGHVLVGEGHPDDIISSGKAPLLGTDNTQRLMVTGSKRGPDPGNLLVKREWDEAEGWMEGNIKDIE